MLFEARQEHFNFLDDLREQGVCNMFQSAPYLMHDFPGLNKFMARKIVKTWMQSKINKG